MEIFAPNPRAGGVTTHFVTGVGPDTVTCFGRAFSN
jgi:hypothetical protein